MTTTPSENRTTIPPSPETVTTEPEAAEPETTEPEATEAETTPAGTAVIVVMGVSGVGKSTIGQLLADRLRWELIEGDDLHPMENVRKMESGIPLDDTDREPWLRKLRRVIDKRRAAGARVIVTCSALKHKYREWLGFPDPEMALVFPVGSVALINERLRGRRGHFMPPSLLQSQIETLEPPGREAIRLDASASPDHLCDQVIRHLALGTESQASRIVDHSRV